MTNRRMATAWCICALAALALAAPADPVTWSFPDPPAKVKPGARFDLKLAARVEDGWHLYSMKPLDEGPIPTRIWLPEGQPAQLAGAIRAAEPEKVQDPSFGMEVELYEGEVEFTLPLKLAASAPAGSLKLAVNASYQSCNNKICLPPKTVKLEAAVTIAR